VNQNTRTARTAPGTTTSGRSSAGRSPGKSAAARTGTRKAAAAGGPRASRASDDRPAADASRRKFVVFLSLVGLLTGTSALLLALAPAPLKPDSAASLFALDAPRSMDVIFDTANPVAAGQWKYIFVHHSQTPSGNAATLAARPGGLGDHFVIGNGTGCVDGEIQIGHRWASQLPAGRTSGLATMRPDCVSICLVGDFNRAAPTPTQRLRLAQLVTALQKQLAIPGGSIHLVQGTNTPADAGRYFPVDTFRQQVMP
jgi:hypothetical protein